jgi:hypothetical protein
VSANAKYFEGSDSTGAYLKARGFNELGNKSGGIISPKQVEIPSGAILFRLFHLTGREFGEWWLTVHELTAVYNYFGRDGPAAAVGRIEGKGILHAVLAVRHDWSQADPAGKPSAEHLGWFVCASPVTPLTAYYGEGDDAPSDNRKEIQKAAKIVGKAGAQVGVRQLFFPQCWDYKDQFTIIDTGWTDSGLSSAVRKHNKGPLPFE